MNSIEWNLFVLYLDNFVAHVLCQFDNFFKQNSLKMLFLSSFTKLDISLGGSFAVVQRLQV